MRQKWAGQHVDIMHQCIAAMGGWMVGLTVESSSTLSRDGSHRRATPHARQMHASRQRGGRRGRMGTSDGWKRTDGHKEADGGNRCGCGCGGRGGAQPRRQEDLHERGVGVTRFHSTRGREGRRGGDLNSNAVRGRTNDQRRLTSEGVKRRRQKRARADARREGKSMAAAEGEGLGILIRRQGRQGRTRRTTLAQTAREAGATATSGEDASFNRAEATRRAEQDGAASVANTR
jgi:hypothetical protein